MTNQKEIVELYINDNKKIALEEASKILKRKETMTMSSFNGIIGGKNDTYSIKISDYDTPDDYIRAWMSSHQKRLNEEKNASYEKSSHRVHELLKSPFVKKFIESYLAGTYFRHGR